MREKAKADSKATLTAKQAAFVREYLIDLNAKQAAIRAGYSEKTAEQQGYQLLQNSSVAAAIQQAMDERSKKTEITAEYVLTSIQKVAERCMQAVPVMEKVDGEWVETGEFKFDSSGANRALELLGKHLKLFADRVEHTGKDGGPVQHEHSISGLLKEIDGSTKPLVEE